MTSNSDSELKSFENIKLVKRLPFKVRERRTKINLKHICLTRHFANLQEQHLVGAVNTNNTELVQKLLEGDANPNSRDRQHRSTLHLAVSKGYADIVALLLKHGADPNKQDIIQNTPLHLAACTSNLQIITMLINAGADIRSLDMHGRNPLQLAESKLQILRSSWKKGAIEMMNLRSQLQEIVDIMISLWKRKESTSLQHERNNLDDLELMKLSLSTTPAEQVDDDMTKLLSELQHFTIK